MKLNLGCGFKHKQGFINIDSAKECKPDKLHDLNKTPYPFKDNSVDYIYTYHALEHLDRMKFIKVLNELYRISKHNAIWEIHVPYWNSSTTANLGHHIHFGFNSFNFIRPKHNRNYFSKVKGEIIYIKGVPSRPARFIPQKFRKWLSHLVSQILIGIEYKIRIIKEENIK